MQQDLSPFSMPGPHYLDFLEDYAKEQQRGFTDPLDRRAVDGSVNLLLCETPSDYAKRIRSLLQNKNSDTKGQ